MTNSVPVCLEHCFSEKKGSFRCGRPALYTVRFAYPSLTGRESAFMCGKHSADITRGTISVWRCRLPEASNG